jgi:L-ascorbate metabolism protein UlaG (beta-lactamase superfamily)
VAGVSIRFLGVAGYDIVAAGGQRILLDPFLDANPAAPFHAADVDRADLILITHGAFDHVGDAGAIARRTSAPVVCGAEVKALLVAQGLPPSQVRATTWGIAVEVAGVRVQPVESRHWSHVTMPDGAMLSGVPMGFVVELARDVRFYHGGDTALFSDLRLIGDLYRPTVGCIGVAQPAELLARIEGPGRVLTGEMTPREGARAAQWLGLSTALPCHFLDPDCDEVQEFASCIAGAKARGEPTPDVVVLRPGETTEVL